MTHYIPEPQVTVLDAGGQYCHLIARKVREQGVYAEVRPSETPARELASRRAIIISGGPSSVYEPESPTVDPQVFSLPAGILGICYGHQLMAHLLGGKVRRGEKGEYGLSFLDLNETGGLLDGVLDHQPVWMSHRDTVREVPAGFRVLAGTATCPVAAMADAAGRRFGLQFHPEVAHTRQGPLFFSNFLFGVCGCRPDWDAKNRLPLVEQLIRETVGQRKVFFFVSGGVDSTVAFTLCLRTLGPERVHGIYVDTGLMREGETEFVSGIFRNSEGAFEVEDARERFLDALAGVTDPEQKRKIIGEEFVAVQERASQSHRFLDDEWILGQGTIYPDTIESGGTAKAAVIKTHHNRVPGIVRLIESQRIVEPLSYFYKDEVREVGRELGLPEDLLQRHPFPGPGLAIRCLCAGREEPVSRAPEGWRLPVRSVGVQGDSRSYAEVVCLDRFPSPEANLQADATELVHRIAGVNRIVALAASVAPVETLRVRPAALTEARLSRLRRADALVRRLSHQSGFDSAVWQFPVILIPVGIAERPDSVVLRPVDSVDGMTAQSVPMDPALLETMAERLLEQPGIAAVFYDLTHKPPATIEWE